MATTRGHGITSAAEWTASRVSPLTYPGAAPDYPYLLVDSEVHPVEVSDVSLGDSTTPDGQTVDEILGDLGAPLLADRIPVVAYGANRSPHTLALKFDHHHYDSAGAGLAVPVFTGTLAGYDIVVGGFSPQGSLYGDLGASEHTVVQVHLALLDRDQARAIHESEGVGMGVYECARVPRFTIEGGRWATSALAYAGCHGAYLSPVDDHPVAFSAIPAQHRSFRSLDQIPALEELIVTTAIEEELRGLLGSSVPSARISTSREVVVEMSRVLSEDWWRCRDGGGEQSPQSMDIQMLLWGTLSRHCAQRSVAATLKDQDLILDSRSVYDSGADMRLAAMLCS